ncbi:MAG: helix-turn-helix domain-containing protein [Treponema sp.]|nr:helix-turn-helix domain-containing protein [Treponema sp.]
MWKSKKAFFWQTDEQILIELGQRLKAARVRARLTQAELAKNSGVAKSTIERAEKGEGLQLLNLVKLFRALNMLSSLENLLPSSEPTPMEYLAVKDSGSLPQRVRASSKANKNAQFKIDHTKPFIWEEDK